MDLIKRHDGMWWPAADKACHISVYRELKHLNRALSLVTDWTTVVQAGGNVGVWPLYLAEHFVEVITFEPDEMNAECMSRNLRDAVNVHQHRAALGSEAARCVVANEFDHNCGASFVEYGDGEVDVMTIDGLNLPSCGLLALDLEGAEAMALAGAVDTIRRCRPVIMIEHKGHCARYGYTMPEVEEELGRIGYRVAVRLPNDLIAVAA